MFFRNGSSSEILGLESIMTDWIRGRRLSLYLPDDSYYRVVFDQTEGNGSVTCKVAVRIGSRTFLGAAKRAKTVKAALQSSLEKVRRIHMARGPEPLRQ